MLAVRVIPCLLLRGQSLVKTVRFKKFGYIGDPVNTCRIFNELEVDELCFLDITASKTEKEPHYSLLKEIASECFMPLSYGGGVKDHVMAEKLFKMGFEKIVVNSAALEKPVLIRELTATYGSQSIIVAIDVKKNAWGSSVCYGYSGTKKYKYAPEEWAKIIEGEGAGEILLTSIDREGTWSGYDIDLIKRVSNVVSIPVIANGGAGSLEHIQAAIKQGDASAVALGSMVVYQKKGMGVLVNFPDKMMLQEIIR